MHPNSFWISCTAAIGLAIPAAADDAALIGEARKCTAIEGAGLRMTCYDAVFKGDGVAVMPAPPPTAVPSPQGEVVDLKNETVPGDQWSIIATTSEMTDKPLVIMRLESTNEASCGRYKDPTPITLLLRCEDNTTNVVIGAEQCFFSSHGGNGRVEYRLDSDPPATARMEASNSNEALGLWSGTRAIPFIKAMFGKTDLLVEMTPFNENSLRVEFDISGTENAVEQLRAACGW